MSEQEKKRLRIYDLLDDESPHPPKNSEIMRVSLWPWSSTDFNLLDWTTWDALENKTNATSDPNIGSIKTTIKEE